MEQPEFTFICIDNSKRMFWLDHIFNDQLDAIELYCAAVFKCNPKSKVCLHTMNSLHSGLLVHPTSELQEILACLQGLRCKGVTNFSHALYRACSTFNHSAPNMKRRLLIFVGSCIDLISRQSESYGTRLKEMGVALNVVNFFLLKMDTSLKGVSILSDKYHYGRDELGELVTTVGNNSQIVDVPDESCIPDILSKFILEKNLHYLEKKAAADNEYVEAPEIQAPRNKYGNLLKITRNEKYGVPASRRYLNMFDIPGINRTYEPGMRFVRPSLRLSGHNEKKTANISGKENQEKAEANVSVKQESKLSCNENYKAAAQGKGIKVFINPETLCDLRRSIEQFHKETSTIAADDECFQAQGKGIEVFIKPETLCDLKRSIEQFHKETSTIAADDECFQAPKNQYLSNVTLPRIKAKKKKNRKKMPMLKQELELSCNEKKKSAADDQYGNILKKTSHIPGNEIQEKVEENVIVKQELDLSCNEKYEAAAQGKGIKVFIKPETEQFYKETSASAADDESVPAPEIQNVSKVTTKQRRAWKKNNQKKMEMFKQESGLSCNEKNQAAAD